MKIQDYLGDGVYAAFDGFGIELRANSPGNPNMIYLEPDVLDALNRFALRAAKIIAQDRLDVAAAEAGTIDKQMTETGGKKE